MLLNFVFLNFGLVPEFFARGGLKLEPAGGHFPYYFFAIVQSCLFGLSIFVLGFRLSWPLIGHSLMVVGIIGYCFFPSLTTDCTHIPYVDVASLILCTVLPMALSYVSAHQLNRALFLRLGGDLRAVPLWR